MVVHPGLRGSIAAFSWTFNMLGRFLQTVMKTASFPFCWDLRRVAISKRCCSSFLDGSGSVWNERGVADALHTSDCSRPCAGRGVQNLDLVLRGIWVGYRAWSFSRGGWEKSSPEGQSVWQQEWSCQFGIGVRAKIYIQLFDLHLCSSGGVWILCIVFIKNQIVQQVGSHQWKVYQCHKELNSIFFFRSGSTLQYTGPQPCLSNLNAVCLIKPKERRAGF